MTETRCLGRTGIEVFPLGFGGIPIQRIDREQADTVIGRAVALGINFIDTARGYTDSEEKIGSALSEIDCRVYLATKTPADDAEGAYRDVEKSLENLGVEMIDIYQLHGVNTRETYEKRTGQGGALEGLKRAQADGLIEHIGITGHLNEVLVTALKTGEFATVQFCYNFIEDDCEKELISTAREYDVGMIGMKPLAGGRLEHAEIALKYVLNQEGVVPIPGMETVDEVEENIGIARGSWDLTASERERKSQLESELGTVFCRRCDYCQPCPQEIRISTVLRAESFINRMPPGRVTSGWIADAFAGAEDCVECEECVERCPYDLPIPDLIRENKVIMDKYLSE